MNRWTDDADSVPGLLPLKKMTCQKENTREQERGRYEEAAVPEVVAETVGVSDLVIGSVTNVEHEIGVQVRERRRTLLNLRS